MRLRLYIDPEAGLTHASRHGVRESEVHEALRCPGEDRPGAEGARAMRQTEFPPGWDEERVRRVLEHYERQSDEQAVAEDEAAYEDSGQTMMGVPNDLVPAVRQLLAERRG